MIQDEPRESTCKGVTPGAADFRFFPLGKAIERILKMTKIFFFGRSDGGQDNLNKGFPCTTSQI
jgi:hypothetical protein